ncbi:TonB-dependent receptor plug domain-containing protein [Undibacterium fentianense]|uniref:TonB-dependent receptor n=1 Tax=Undibacterium fentianense TaxID=2828728 RepID=A0A941IGZ1_9BURK|nr:TonB-dependent receptor [Undibacterium fentianense]MBR7800475.1 TonB-dependent receptor [Undibacterium fentianense]
MQIPKSSVITLILCNVMAVSAHAQQSSETKAQVQAQTQTQRVEVQGKSQEEFARTETAARSIVSNAELTRFGDNNIVDAMKRVPGVQVTNNKLHLLGMAAGYTQILIDGEAPRGITIEDIPLNMIERVEIYRGANAQFSTQAMAGTINIILKKAASNKQHSLKASIGHMFQNNGGVDWFHSDKNGNLSHTVSASLSKDRISAGQSDDSTTNFVNENILTGNKSQFQNVSHSKRGDESVRISPRIQYKTDSNINLTSTSIFAHNRFNADTTSQFNNVAGRVFEIGKTTSHDTNRGTNFGSTLKAVTSLDNQIGVDVSAGFQAQSFIARSHSQNYLPDGTLQFNRDMNTDVHVVVGITNGKLSIPTNAEHDLVVGWSGWRANVDVENNQSDRFASSQYDIYRPHSANSVMDNAAFYAQDDWKFKKNSSVSLGLRWESQGIRTENNFGEKVSNRASVLSPVIQTMWQLDPQNTERVRLGVSRTFKAPEGTQLLMPKIYVINNSIESPNVVGNPNLRPELSWSIDAAFEHNGKDGLNYAIRAKAQSIEDIHREVVFEADKAYWKKFVNAGTAQSQSIELSTQFPLKRWMDKAPDMDFSASYSHFWSNVKDLATPYNSLTPYQYVVTFGANYRAKDIPLTAGISAKIQDSHWQQISLTERQYLKTPKNVDVYALWKFDKQSQMRFALNNLLGGKAYDSFTYASVGNARSQSARAVPTARNLSMTYEYKF